MIKLSEAVEKISEDWVQKLSIRISVSLNKTNKRTNWQTHKKKISMTTNIIYFFPCFLASLLNYGAMIQAKGRYKSSNKIMVNIWIQLSYDISCFLLYCYLKISLSQGFINLLTDSFTRCHTAILLVGVRLGLSKGFYVSVFHHYCTGLYSKGVHESYQTFN